MLLKKSIILSRWNLYTCSIQKNRNSLFNKNILNTEDGFNAVLEATTYSELVVLIHTGHHIPDSCLQWVLSIVGFLVYLLLNHISDVVAQRIQVRRISRLFLGFIDNVKVTSLAFPQSNAWPPYTQYRWWYWFYSLVGKSMFSLLTTPRTIIEDLCASYWGPPFGLCRSNCYFTCSPGQFQEIYSPSHYGCIWCHQHGRIFISCLRLEGAMLMLLVTCKSLKKKWECHNLICYVTLLGHFPLMAY